MGGRNDEEVIGRDYVLSVMIDMITSKAFDSISLYNGFTVSQLHKLLNFCVENCHFFM